MRTLKFTLMATLAFAFSVATAQASSVDIIWQNSGTGTTSASASSTIVGDLVVTVGTGDTTIGGVGAGFEISSDVVSGSVVITNAAHVTLAGWLDLTGGFSVTATHVENNVGEGDLFGSGASIAPGGSAVVGTITVHVGGPGQVLAGLTGPTDDIISSGVGGSIASEFTFGGGLIIPEPTTASLLGLGLVGLTLAGRRRS